MNLENPLILSFIIYIPLCIFIIHYKKKLLYLKKTDISEGNLNSLDKNSNNLNTLFSRNINLIFVVLPFFIYGLSSIYISSKTRNEYCKYLSQKDLKIKDLLKKCKSKK